MVLSQLSQFLSYAFLIQCKVNIYIYVLYTYTYLLTIMISITWDLKPAKKRSIQIHPCWPFFSGFEYHLRRNSGRLNPVSSKGETTEVLGTVRPWMILGHQKKAAQVMEGLEKTSWRAPWGMIRKPYSCLGSQRSYIWRAPSQPWGNYIYRDYN